jgi:FkbM family methyltransferase
MPVMESPSTGPGARAYGFVYRYTTAFVKSAGLVASSLRLWPFGFWLKFWVYRGEELLAPIQSFRFYVRTRRLHRKLTDLYMITSCIVSEQYTSEPGFQLGAEDVVIDIGAHIGSFSVYAGRRAPRGRVFSFEPDDWSHRQLVKNLAINEVANVKTFRGGVGGKSGTRNLYAAKLNSAENNFYWGGAQADSVDCVTLADIFAEHKLERCDFMKIDCEGAEYEILLNTPMEVLRKIRRISVECHVGRYFGLADESARPEVLIEFLRRAGFTVKVLKENELHTFLWANR